MKSKKNKSITSPLNILNNSFSLNQKDISIKEEKKGGLNGTNSYNYCKNKKSRQTNSLEKLSKKFLKCVFESGNNIINLKTLMQKMKVKKRRIYDITNVLEGK